jgi:pilus assembly protein CpaB
MLKHRWPWLAALLLLAGAGAALVAVPGWFRNPSPHMPSREEKVPVIVTTLDVPRFDRLTGDHVEVKEYPKDLVPPDALRDVQDALGRVALQHLSKGELVLGSKLAAATPGGPPNPKAGMRAVAILTRSAPAHLIPGSKVDVLFTSDVDGRRATTLILQSVEIWAVDPRPEVSGENKADGRDVQSVVLLVTPAQATKVELVQNKTGTLHLALPNR